MKGFIKDEWLIPVGSLCLAIAILSDRFLLIDDPFLDFVVGILTGLAMVLNLVGLYRMRQASE